MKLLNITNIYLGHEHDDPDKLTNITLRAKTCGQLKEMYLKFSDQHKAWVVDVCFPESSSTIRFIERLDAERFYNDIFDWACAENQGHCTIDTRDYSAL